MPNAVRLPELTSARLRLRPLDGTDIDALFAIFSNPEITRYWSSATMTSPADAKALLAEIEDLQARGELMEWGLERREDGALVGTCSLSNIDLDNRRGEIGFALGRFAWGHGYMREALPVLVEYAFTTLNLHRLEADVDPRNASSLRLLESLGFKIEGHLRERWQATGEIQDSLFLGLLAREWLGSSIRLADSARLSDSASDVPSANTLPQG